MLELGQDFVQQEMDERLKDDMFELIRLAVREDLDRSFDLTTVAMVPAELKASAEICPRSTGTAAGFNLLPWMIEALDVSLFCKLNISDGGTFSQNQSLATLQGNARDILTCERILLNFLGRLCGIATWTQQHVALLDGLDTKLYDTRKTTPGWRRLEKYATRCGGARNHRSGLYEAFMVKDNHLACNAHQTGKLLSPREVVEKLREFSQNSDNTKLNTIVEIEVDTLEQLDEALQANPDIVLLDNMSVETLCEAVAIRNSKNAGVQLEASGGITQETLRAKAETGVERISLGALTHSAVNLDLGLDWKLQ